MVKNSLLFLTIVLFFGCNQKVKSIETEDVTGSTTSKKATFEMYEMSELAMLMEQMYAYNMQLRTRIIKHENLGEFPNQFDKIHTALMTDPADNDLFFQEQATNYLLAQKKIYTAPNQATENFNAMVQSCLDCHAKKCGGPIPRIKKLFIQQ